MTLSYLLELRLSSPLSPSTSFWSIPFPSEPSPSSSPSQSSSSSTITSTSQSNKIWSQQILSSPPLSIQTCQLWTPSRSLPLQTPLPQLKRQQQGDFRFGPLSIERIKLSSSSMNPSSSSNIAQLPPGSLHLYKHPSHSSSSSSLDASHTLALVSVPTLLNPTQILQFIANSSESDSEWLLNGLIEEMRILRDHNPGRSIVLIKFRPQEGGLKEKFREEFEGKKYWESKDSEICQILEISQIKLTTPLSPISTTTTTTTTKGGGVDNNTLVELPTCAICLEKLDSRSTGLIQIQCKHNFHCNCLLRWRDSRCPICRATQLASTSSSSSLTKPSNSSSNTSTEVNQAEVSGAPQDKISNSNDERERECGTCQSLANLWICLICGNIGCGRYQGGDAYKHFVASDHSYSLELETGRIWSYTDDEYVHRLLRLPSSTSNNSNSKLIELPSLPSSHHGTTEDLSPQIADAYNEKLKMGGPDHLAEEEQSKLEQIALEYSQLLSFQLREQREWFEVELERCKRMARVWEGRCEGLERGNKGLESEKKRGKERELEREEELGRMRKRLEGMEKELKRGEEERRRDKLEQGKVRRELESLLEQEKAVTMRLTRNLGGMKEQLGERQRETEQVRGEVEELKDQLNDLMAALTMRDKIEGDSELAKELREGTMGVVTQPARTEGMGEGASPSQVLAAKRKKKNKKK